jgi:hypothetical protein
MANLLTPLRIQNEWWPEDWYELISKFLYSQISGDLTTNPNGNDFAIDTCRSVAGPIQQLPD